jgi:hypothetical protein
MKTRSITLGDTVRALRLGFYPYHKIKGFVRISGDGPFHIEIHPYGLISNSHKSNMPHRVWWSKNSNLPSQIPALQYISKVKLPFSFYIDDNGNKI